MGRSEARRDRARAAASVVVLAATLGCDVLAPQPGKPAASASASASARGDLGLRLPAPSARPRREPPKREKMKVVAKPVASVKPSDGDPVAGKWTLADAVKGLPKGKHLVATIDTDLGDLTCTLFDDRAPITVASFVGLARGVRPWRTPEGEWVTKPAYDGTVFHRIVKGFMIQGGDARKNGTGEAGFLIPDEIWEDANHDRAGLLCMANRGKNTNSAQFFITDGEALHLDGGYTIFGECGPLDLIHQIASVDVVGERPKVPPVIERVTIARTDEQPALGAAPAASASSGPASSASAGPAPSASAPAPAASPVAKPTGSAAPKH